jgi:hypothetical protein
MRIERLIPCPPKDLWGALIRHTELAEHGPVLHLALPCGLSKTEGRITVYESQRVLECALGADVLRWELHPRGEHTLLVFTHAECAAQWLAWLDGIAAAATGAAEAELTP